MEKNSKKMLANVLTKTANKALKAAANSRCMFIYHQPKQPEGVKKFRKF